jgi:hypothetical protein
MALKALRVLAVMWLCTGLWVSIVVLVRWSEVVR